MFNKYLKLNTSLIMLFIVLHIRDIAAYQCYRCQGSNCQNESKLMNSIQCANPRDDCVSVFSVSNILERGCYSTLPEIYRSKCDTYNTTECHRCFGEICNDKGPSYCLQCNSRNDRNCFPQPVDIEASYCPISVQTNSYCFIRYNSSGFYERGCLLGEEERTDCEKRITCGACFSNAGIACNDDFHSLIMGASQAKVYSLLIAVASLIAICVEMIMK